jgi:hypothetical protein
MANEPHKSVTVALDGDQIVTIETNCLSGREIGDDGTAVILWAIDHLTGFIGAAQNISPSALAAARLAGKLEGLREAIKIAENCTRDGETTTQAMWIASALAARIAKEQDPLTATPKAPMAEGWSEAARDVLAERQRQISAEGWTPEHDDKHTDGDLALAAACYAIMAKQSDKSRTRIMGERTHDGVPFLVKYWPWSMSWWKPTDRRRDLIKSCALALAEIERLDRLPAPPTTGEQK